MMTVQFLCFMLLSFGNENKYTVDDPFWKHSPFLFFSLLCIFSLEAIVSNKISHDYYDIRVIMLNFQPQKGEEVIKFEIKT